MAPSTDIVLYLYTYSPYARKIVWYLNLRKISYTQCLQPPIMPREDVSALGVQYRRIPLMAIGRDIYHDTRLIISKLEELFPASSTHPAISAKNDEQRAIEKLLEYWTVDGGMFARASQLIPTSMPLMKDDKFLRDREQYTGRSWSLSSVDANRPEAIVEIASAFKFLEETLLADGREWILKTKGPSLADIEGVWPFHWLQGMKDALPSSISSKQYPKVFQWINRFQQTVSASAKANGKPKTLKGPEAVALIESSDFAETSGGIDPNDATGLKLGAEVEVWPIDTGFKNKDRGALSALTASEIVIEIKTKQGKVVRVHAPRHGFRIRAVRQESSLKL